YELTALAACLEGSILAIDRLPEAPAARSVDEHASPPPTARGERAVRAARAALSPYWRGI
ncbi:MAG TPA: hypothetical protein VLD67_15205, partial [Vicinamibacterales bacterium]|nr:hypothetical protein [Vicinamibacterales bacterium]